MSSLASLSPFDPATLAVHVERALADIPEGKRTALVAVATLNGTVELRFASRIGDHWRIGAVVRKERGAPIDGGVEVKAVW